MEPLDRATIWPYRDGEPGGAVLPALRPPERARGRASARRSSRAARRSSSPPAPGRRRRWCSAFLEPGQTIALAEGGYYGTGVLFDDAGALGRAPRRVRPDRPAARGRRPRLARGALEPVPDHAGPRGRRRLAARAWWSTRPRRPPSTCGRSSTAPTSPSTARPSSSAATTTCCWARSPAARPRTPSALRDFRGRTGIVAAPDPCWLLSRSLKTLRVRMERHTASATEIAERLRDAPGGRARPLSGLRRPALVRRRRRRGRSARSRPRCGRSRTPRASAASSRC